MGIQTQEGRYLYIQFDCIGWLNRQIEFDNMEAFRVAQRTLVRRGRLGGRFMKLEAVRSVKVWDVCCSWLGILGIGENPLILS